MKRSIVCFLIIFIVCGCSSFPKKSHAGQSVPAGRQSAESNAAPDSEKTEIVSSQDAQGIRLFLEVNAYIKSFYYKDVDPLACVKKVLKTGVSGCTDPYSFYLNSEEVKDEQTNFIHGEFGGIGANLEMIKDGVGATVTRVEEESPAARAGLVPGDLIVKISTKADNSKWIPLEDLDIHAVVQMIRGPVGTKVMLKIARGKEEKDFIITREIIKINFLESKKIGKTGYLKIKEFAGNQLAADIDKILDKFKSENIRVVIIDLRYNPGGLLSLVLDIASSFSQKESSSIIFTKTRNGGYADVTNGDMDAPNKDAGKFKNFKIIVLQNEYSASASEILSGYLKEECGAIVIGKKSFGKGVVQRLFQLSGGGELHLTVAEYFIGKNLVKVQGIGIKPTIEVENPKEVKKDADDLQFKRALEEAEKLLNTK